MCGIVRPSDDDCQEMFIIVTFRKRPRHPVVVWTGREWITDYARLPGILAADEDYLPKNQRFTAKPEDWPIPGKTVPKSESSRSHRKFASASSEFCLPPDASPVLGFRRSELWRRAKALTFYYADFLIGSLNPDPVKGTGRPSNYDGLN